MFIMRSTEFVGEPVEPPVQPVISEWKLDQVIDSFGSNNYALSLWHILFCFTSHL